MPNGGDPVVPISRLSYASQTADEAWDALSRMYTGVRPLTSAPDAEFKADSVVTPGLAVDRVWLHAAAGGFDTSPDQLNFISLLDGRLNLDLGRRGAVANSTGDSYLYPPDSTAELEWDTFSALTVRVPISQVAQGASAMTGIRTDEMRFLSVQPLTPAHGQVWMRTVTTIWEELTAAGSAAVEPLAHRTLLDMVTATAVSMFPNSAMTSGYLPAAGNVHPTAVRRAVAFIDANASLPITVTDIADSAGTTPRALRAAFRRHLDTTPTSYLRRVRLDAAREDLRAADPTEGATVARIAARWGFRQTGRFATDYHHAYGESPNRTLHT